VVVIRICFFFDAMFVDDRYRLALGLQ